MKRIPLFIFLAVLPFVLFSCGGGSSSGSDSQNQAATVSKEINSLKADGLNGDIKSVRQRVYWSLEKFGRIEKGKLQNMKAQDFLKVYNEDGFLIEETHYDVSDKEMTRLVISYTGKNKPEKEVFYTEGKLTSVTNYTYENNVLKQKETLDENDKLKERYEYSYYDNGLLMDEDKYGANNQLAQKTVHTYNDSGKLFEKQYYWGGGSPYKKETFKYDENGNSSTVKTDKYQKKDPIFDGLIEYEDYNSRNDYQTKNTYNKESEKVETVDYVYNAYGNLTTYLIKKLTKETVKYEVDEIVDAEDSGIDDYIVKESGGVVTEVVNNWVISSGESFEYTYDAQNNWTRKITYKIDSEETHSRQFYYERIIEYR